MKQTKKTQSVGAYRTGPKLIEKLAGEGGSQWFACMDDLAEWLNVAPRTMQNTLRQFSGQVAKTETPEHGWVREVFVPGFTLSLTDEGSDG